MRLTLWIVGALLLLVSVGSAFSQVVDFNDACYNGSILGVTIGFAPGDLPSVNGILTVNNDCSGGTGVTWQDGVNVTLGNVSDGDVVITPVSVFVDSVARPDLDVPAVVTFRHVPFAVKPQVFRDGVLCDEGVGCSNVTWSPNSRTFSVHVDGFSNYSLQGLQQFSVYSDPEPELRDRVYQSVDLNDSNRGTQFKCVVQVYGLNQNGQQVLVQTNPQRNVAAKLWGSPDTNNPESLGYFPTENGLANVYFDGSTLAGYEDLEYVVMCASNTTNLVYEEPLSTRYIPPGRSLIGRGLWITEGDNGFYLVIIVIGGLLVIWIIWMIVRRSFGR